jgi:hypothetical protein
MKYTSTFILRFSLGLLLCSASIQAQDTIKKDQTQATEKKQDSIPPKLDRYGVRVGVDLYKLTRSIYDSDYKGVEVVGDYRLTRKFYIAGELGTEDKTTDEDQLNFTTKGSYFKVGFDYNTYENWLDMENLITIGLRYGVSTFSQQLNSYTVYNANPYFGQATTVVSGEKYNGLSAGWAEVILGVKAEVFNNFYVGFNVSLKRMISNKQPENFENLYVPGFNRTYDGDFGAGFNYTVSYFIPIYKKKVKPAEKAKKEQNKEVKK